MNCRKTINKNLIAVIFATIALIVPATLGAIYLFKSLNAHNGITSSQINCILKDSRGYVWFGTPAGLYRYDGYEYKAFQSNSQDGSSLPDSYIKHVYEALNGELWIETASGFTIYHPQSESFDNDMNSVLTKMNVNGEPKIIYIDSRKNIWMYVPGTGVYCYNLAQQLLYEYGYTDNSIGIPEGDIASIGECKEGAILVYTNGRVVCVDVSHQQRTVWANDMLVRSHIHVNTSFKAFSDRTGSVWLYGDHTLLNLDHTGNWSSAVGDKLGINNSDCSVCSMAGDKNNNIWVATDTHGLIRIDALTHETEFVTPVNKRQEPVASTNIQSVYVDDSNLLWVGTSKQGVCYYGPNIYKFDLLGIGDVSAMCEDGNGNVWYGTSDAGINGYHGQIASRQISSMAYTKDGSIWAGSTANGLTRIKGGKSTVYTTDDSTSSVIDNHINDLVSDRSGNLWIATNGGLQVFSTIMNTFSTYTKENGKLQSNDITALNYSPDGNRLFIGSSEGLIIMQLSSHDMAYYTGNSTNLKTFTNNYVTQVYCDSRHLIWVGTREGLNILNLDNDSLNYITEKDGLCNNSICGVTEDKNHNMWVTTNNGVCRIIVQRNHDDGTYSYNLYNYDTSDGLQSNEFNMGSILTTSKGQVLMGGMYGVNWINNEEKPLGKDMPKVILSQLFIGDEEIETGHSYDGRVPLPVALNESSKLDLTHSQNTFTVKFAASNYNRCDGTQFIYWLEGHDEIWHNADAMQHGVTFTSLGSGDYTLHVKAVDTEGDITGPERTLLISIHHPWWLSVWAFLAYIVILAFGTYFWRIGFKKIAGVWVEKRTIVKILRKQSDEVKQTSDEIRKPMARMVTLINTLKERELSFETKELLETLQYQVMQISGRVTDMRMQLDTAQQRAAEQAAPQLDNKGNVMINNNANALPSKEDAEAEEEKEEEQTVTQAPTMRYLVVLIDDDKEFLNYIAEQFDQIYTLATYDDIQKAASDLNDLMADLVICKQDMSDMTGSELCNQIKMNPVTERTKFVLLTDYVLTPQQIKAEGITLSADDYMSKPFNLKEAVRRFNVLLGYIERPSAALVAEAQQLIENKNTETKQEADNTPAGITDNDEDLENTDTEQDDDENNSGNNNSDSTDKNEESHSDNNKNIDETTENITEAMAGNDEPVSTIYEDITGKELIKSNSDENPQAEQQQDEIGLYSMLNLADRQLLINIEQYVVQNMSRGNISLDNLAAAMGMGRVPLFHKIKAIAHRTPAELVRDIRLRHAANLLVKTPMNMNDIAIELGFMTVENFINQFKDRFGVSPLQYQQSKRAQQ